METKNKIQIMQKVREALNHPKISDTGNMIFPIRLGYIAYGVCDIICAVSGSEWQELVSSFYDFAEQYRNTLNNDIYLWGLNEDGRLARIDAVDRFIKVLEAAN